MREGRRKGRQSEELDKMDFEVISKGRTAAAGAAAANSSSSSEDQKNIKRKRTSQPVSGVRLKARAKSKL